MILHSLYLTGFKIADILPLKGCYILAEVVAWLYCTFARKDRKIIAENLRVILGEDVSEKEVKQYMYRIIRNFAKYLADFFKSVSIPREQILNSVTVKNSHYVDEALKGGRGVIIYTAHIGNWELGGAAIAQLGYPISAIVLEHSDQRINKLFKNNRDIKGLKGIPIGMSVKKCFKVLRNNELLAIAGDRDYTGGGIEVDFFGRGSIMPKGAAVLSLKTGAPVIPTFLVRQEDDTFLLEFNEPIKAIQSGNSKKDIKELMNQFVHVLESHVLRYIDQWYIFEKLWK